ncbi:hypothetical protein [Mucilaginibacter defluvii]
MKDRCLAILLLIALISSGFSRSFVYAGFQVNQQYIAEKLCENRARPLLHCNGKCYLMKKLKAAEDKEKEQTAKDNLNRLEISFFQEPFKLSFVEPIVLDNNPALVSTYGHQYSSQYLDAIFRPPRQIA